MTQKRTPPPPKSSKPAGAVKFGKPTTGQGHRICLYGPGGIGKTTLASTLPSPVFFDLDESLGTLGIDLPVVTCDSFADIRKALAAPGWDDVGAIVIDTGTRAEELAAVDTLENVPHEKGHRCKRIEDYGYGKGYTHVFDTFMTLLGDLDRHVRQGRHVCIICHDCTSNVPNPQGEDWLRYEPRLQSPASGKASIRLRVREWCDHVLCAMYDVAVNKDGKGTGHGSRTLYRQETPACMAKSRTGAKPMPLDGNGQDVWAQIITTQE